MGLCLRRLVLQDLWRGGRFHRNQWQLSIGISGNLRPESVAGFDRNQWQPSTGIRRRSYPYIFFLKSPDAPVTPCGANAMRGEPALSPVLAVSPLLLQW